MLAYWASVEMDGILPSRVGLPPFAVSHHDPFSISLGHCLVVDVVSAVTGSYH